MNLMYMGKAHVEKDSTIWIASDMKVDHQIFGYKKKDITSQKMIVISIFTGDVENNPHECKYGAFYNTEGMDEFHLKYLETDGDFAKVAFMKNKRKIDEFYMEAKWIVFEE